MEATNTKVEVLNPRIYFYYPAWNKKFVRRTIAGVVIDQTLYVAQAAVFPGFKPELIPVPLRNGQIVYVVDPGMKPDVFSRVEGRRIATERCTGKKIIGDKVYNVPKQILFKLDLPNGDNHNPGKIFVGAVENYLVAKGFPARAPKAKKKEAPEPGPAGSPAE